jgi:glycosyltransferase involved in cell wall biosynthesis
VSSQPEVSIVVPTRDRWHLLSSHALPSALGQAGVAVEVIVVDDGSTDGTREELARIHDARLRVLRNSRSGVASARNTGIAAAHAPWVAFLDDDDLWSPEKLRKQLDVVGSRSWVFGAAIVVDETLSPLYALPLQRPDGLADALRRGNLIPAGMSNVVARTALVRELGGFDEQLSHSADWDLWLKLVDAGPPAVADEVLVATLEHANRMIFRDRPDVFDELEHIFARHGGPSRSQRLSLLEWLAAEHHRSGQHLHAARLYLHAAVRFRSPGNLVAAVGALFGERGISAASRFLRVTRGSSHMTQDRRAVADPPAWLDGVVTRRGG